MKSNEGDQVVGRRESLHQATIDLESALGAPVVDLTEWSGCVHEAAVALDARIVAHSARSEAPGEFLTTISVEAPHLASSARHLEEEHIDLTDRAAALVGLVDGISPHDPPTVAEDVRRKAEELLGLLERHLQRGTDLMFLAHNADLGSSG